MFKRSPGGSRSSPIRSGSLVHDVAAKPEITRKQYDNSLFFNTMIELQCDGLSAVQDYGLFRCGWLTFQDIIIKIVIMINEPVKRLIGQQGFSSLIDIVKQFLVYGIASYNHAL